ncbi:MAG: DUF86 domain-containing protein [Holosporaceae bacterium]|jgi:uncharacterized protein with HEPN domain|nr:DUF86 domain-containing protein [Holosporaceae bacterium]
MKNDLFYLNHVVETAEIITFYANEVSLDDFLKNRMLCDAVMRNLQILSESTQIPNHAEKLDFYGRKTRKFPIYKLAFSA